MNPMHTSRWERTYMWPFLETRRFFTALGRHWKRIVIGAFAGWLAAVVLGAVALVLLERWNRSRSAGRVCDPPAS